MFEFTIVTLVSLIVLPMAFNQYEVFYKFWHILVISLVAGITQVFLPIGFGTFSFLATLIMGLILIKPKNHMALFSSIIISRFGMILVFSLFH